MVSTEYLALKTSSRPNEKTVARNYEHGQALSFRLYSEESSKESFKRGERKHKASKAWGLRDECTKKDEGDELMSKMGSIKDDIQDGDNRHFLNFKAL